MQDLHNNIHPRRGISPAAAVADNTPFVSQIVDLQGYEAAEFVILTGSLADADATFATLVEHGDAANLSDAAALPDDQLLGLENQASFSFGDDDKVFKIGLRTSKRYARVTITPVANTSNAFVAGVWILGHPRNAPTPNPPG
ncbi:MAG: hypothetical protein AB7I59_21785 [Geminicoccaceae bacterium]